MERLLAFWPYSAFTRPPIHVGLELARAAGTDQRSETHHRPEQPFRGTYCRGRADTLAGHRGESYGLASLEHTFLRRSYVPWPRAHLCEAPHSTATIMISRMWGEDSAALFARIPEPETKSLVEIAAELQAAVETPVETFHSFRALRILGRLPRRRSSRRVVVRLQQRVPAPPLLWDIRHHDPGSTRPVASRPARARN